MINALLTEGRRERMSCKVVLTFAISLCLAAGIVTLAHRRRISIGELEGRSFMTYPSPRCCFTADCLAATHEAALTHRDSSSPKHAFVTSLRSPEYLTLLKDLQCSLNATNPGVPLLVLAVAQELHPDVTREIKSFAQYREVPNIEFPSKEARYGKNWVKMNAWNLTEFDSLILLDADTVVLGDLQHIFDLPTDFAWTYLNAPNGYAWNIGGFIMLRPCVSVFSHMLHIVEHENQNDSATSLPSSPFLHGTLPIRVTDYPWCTMPTFISL